MKWKNIGYDSKEGLASFASKTPREILGVAPNADIVEIRTAYKKLVRSYHPDSADPFMREHSQSMLKVINEAYDRLKDEL